MPMTMSHFRLTFIYFMSLFLLGCAAAPVPNRLQFLGYQGHVNDHQIVVRAPAPHVYSLLTDFDTFASLIPSNRILVTKVTPDPMDIGTITSTETGYKIKLRWHSKVVEKKADRLIVLQFQDGIFHGGYEVWNLQPEGNATRVSHTIVYNISNPVYRLLWMLKHGESKHDVLVEATLLHLKERCEGTEIVQTGREPTTSIP